MSISYPYPSSSIIQTHAYLPFTPMQEILKLKESHMIFIQFLLKEEPHDPIQVRDFLIFTCGGQLCHFGILRHSPSIFTISIPEYLDWDEVVNSVKRWGWSRGIEAWPWNLMGSWHIQPRGFIVYITIFNCPIAYWFSLFFKLITTSFGRILSIDDTNLSDGDKTNLRITLHCVDPSSIPWYIITHNDPPLHFAPKSKSFNPRPTSNQ